jgi:hypothetical protein
MARNFLPSGVYFGLWESPTRGDNFNTQYVPSITCFRRQFLRKMWPIQLAFRIRISCKIFLCSLTLSNTSSFLTWSIQLIFSILLQHHISKPSRQVIEGKIKGEMEVTGRRGRRRKKLPDDLKDRRGYSHLKEEALDRTVWRNRFGKGLWTSR